MTTDVETAFECTNEPPHRFAISDRLRNSTGILVTLQRIDAPYPRRDVFVTNREMKMANDNILKACFVCVDQGRKETAIVISKAELEFGLPPS